MTRQGQSFQPKLRLKTAAEFKKVFSNPIKSVDRHFTLLAIANENGHPRVGLAITKKMIKKATDRNRIKRISRESFRMHQQILGGIDIVVLARKEVLDVPSKLLSESLSKHWHKLASKCAAC